MSNTMIDEKQLQEIVDHRNDMKRKEKLKLPKIHWAEQSAEERVKNIFEVPLGYTEMQARAEAVRCLGCKKKQCQTACPVNIDVPTFVQLVAEGKFREAIRVIKETNLLPAITGRVCPQEVQCQEPCTLGRAAKDVNCSIAIGQLEAFLADWERRSGEIELPTCAPPTGKKVAVVGGGPAGLTTAVDLRRLGHEVTLFEAFQKLGGVLVYGIPEFRLPKDIVKQEAANLERLGVEIVTNCVIGQTITIDELLEEEGFDAVFIGTGAGLPWFLMIPGEDLNGVYSANEYLTRANLMGAYEFPAVDTPVMRAKRVAVFGGGNVAMDAARTALRLGAEDVYLVYRRTEEEMPARVEEIEHAKEEGVQWRLLRAPIEFVGDENGWLQGVRCQVMELGEPDASGRRRPVPIEGRQEFIECDAIVVAIGNGPNPLIPNTTPGLKVKPRKETIAVDWDSLMTSREGVFAGGDIIVGASTVIMAMGHGRQAAAVIQKYLEDGEWKGPGEDA